MALNNNSQSLAFQAAGRFSLLGYYNRFHCLPVDHNILISKACEESRLQYRRAPANTQITVPYRLEGEQDPIKREFEVLNDLQGTDLVQWSRITTNSLALCSFTPEKQVRILTSCISDHLLAGLSQPNSIEEVMSYLKQQNMGKQMCRTLKRN